MSSPVHKDRVDLTTYPAFHPNNSKKRRRFFCPNLNAAAHNYRAAIQSRKLEIRVTLVPKLQLILRIKHALTTAMQYLYKETKITIDFILMHKGHGSNGNFL